MDKLEDVMQESLTRYYTKLTVFGCCKYESVYRLLIMDFIEELLENSLLSQFITDGDYRVLQTALTNLYGSTCIIPNPNYISSEDLTSSTVKDFTPRVTEETVMVTTEQEELRTSS